MNKGHPTTAFYVECLMLIVVFIGILLVLTQVFGLSRNESVQAKLLTNAVTLAQNAADAFLLEDNAARQEQDECHRYTADMVPDPDGQLSVQIHWTKKEGMLEGAVSVFDARQKNPIYTLSIAKFVGEVSP